MEIITIKVQTQAQVEMILAKIKEVGNEEMTITTKHSVKKKGEKVMVKPKVSKRLKAIERGLKEVKAIQRGEQQPKTMQQFLMELNSNG